MSSSTPSPSLQQFLDLLDAGDYYGAHQKARTSATRLLAPPRRTATPATSSKNVSSTSPTNPLPFDSKAQQASELLWQASRKLMEQGQIGSGVDLAIYLLDIYKTRNVGCGPEERAKMLQSIALTGPAGAWRKTLTDNIFSWSSKTGVAASGDPEIHLYLGQLLYKEQNYHNASLHLLLVPTQDSARTLAEVMFAWSQLDPSGLNGLGRYAARATLSYLESHAILAARTFLSHFLSSALKTYPVLLVKSVAYPSPTSPLGKNLPSSEQGDELILTKLQSLNFLQLAVRTIQVGAGETVDKYGGANGGVKKEVRGGGKSNWVKMCARYEKEVQWFNKSPEIKESLQELGIMYFGIKPPQQASNPFAAMMSGLMGGGGGAPALGR
ncbi:BQ5605_C018g08598 [Microbotryum silenes-dioicae]|uniref:BQ5605_C018g08598 protein n=1 Tax=Microbotryum silenes-dioicae TaxID=796604 RepID=A0A2X0M0F9_9BASI|nr:BQ5605_C018g08598 [Microbotryum silenes-dioicae]